MATQKTAEEIYIDNLKYSACSLRERLLLFSYLSEHPEVNVSEYTLWSGYSFYDAIVSSGSTTEKIVEIKFREFYSNQFSTTFIEQNKFHKLRQYAEDIYQPVEYWNFFIKDGILEVFDLNNVEWEEESIKRSAKDYFDSDNIDESEVIALKKSSASYYKFDSTLDYTAMALHQLAKRRPDDKEIIAGLNLSKYDSYIKRKLNENK